MQKRHGTQASGLQDAGGTPALHAYADAVATYLAFVISKGANLWSSIVSWMNDRGGFGIMLKQIHLVVVVEI